MNFRFLEKAAWIAWLISTPGLAYYSPHSTEAILHLDAPLEVQLERVRNIPSAEALSSPTHPHRKQILDLIEGQLLHLVGLFQSDYFEREVGVKGVLGERRSVRITGVEAGASGEPGRFLIHYHADIKVLFDSRVFEREANSERVSRFEVLLPLAPDRNYAEGVVGSQNRCTDPDFNGIEDFWYFWNPEQEGCPLKGDRQKVVQVFGQLERLKNTQLSYPHYDDLYGANQNGKTFEASVFFGYITDVAGEVRRAKRDSAYASMRFLEADLKSRGFERIAARDAFRRYRDGSFHSGQNFERLYELSSGRRGLQGKRVRVKILVADTSIEAKDTTFHAELLHALRLSDIVLFDGHSGLGATLSLSRLPKFRLHPAKSQVFFFNACSSYPFFNDAFFRRKGGAKNLEILLAGLPTWAPTSGPNAVTFLANFLEGKRTSYQQLLGQIEASNGELGSSLLGVSGDEEERK